MAQRENEAGFPDPAVLRRLLKTLPTPCFLYDEEGLRRSARALRSAFWAREGDREYFPLRLCARPVILQLLREEGCGVSCATLTELRIAERCGFSGAEVLYAPLLCDRGAEALALRLRAVWLLDGPQTLPGAPPAGALLAWNPRRRLQAGARSYSPFDRSKFGMDERTLAALAVQLRHAGVQTVGAALPLCGGSLDPDFYPAAAELLFAFCARLRETAGFSPDVCWLGDGLGISCRPEYPAPALADCGGRIRALAREAFGDRPPPLLTGIGRRLIAGNAVFLTRVVAVKERACPLVLTDGCGSQFLHPLFPGAFHRILAPGWSGKNGVLCDVAGCSAECRDRFADGCILPPLRPGDPLVICDAGGWTYGAGGAAERACAEYLVRGDGSAVPVGPRQTPEDDLERLMFPG